MFIVPFFLKPLYNILHRLFLSVLCLFLSPIISCWILALSSLTSSQKVPWNTCNSFRMLHLDTTFTNCPSSRSSRGPIPSDSPPPHSVLTSEAPSGALLPGYLSFIVSTLPPSGISSDLMTFLLTFLLTNLSFFLQNLLLAENFPVNLKLLYCPFPLVVALSTKHFILTWNVDIKCIILQYNLL